MSSTVGARGGMSLANVLLAAVGALLIWQLTAGVAQATFLGTNGKLAISSPRSGFPADNDLYTMNCGRDAADPYHEPRSG